MMSEPSKTPESRATVSEAMLIRLRNAAEGISDFAEVILDTPGIGGRYGGVDGRETLIDILRSLVVLTGTEEDAIDWLFSSRGYAAIAKDDICSNIMWGDFWTLTTIKEWLQVIEAYRAICPGLIEVIFRGGAVPQNDRP